MKKQLNSWIKRFVGVLLVGAIAVSAVELSQLNIAIIWNDQTYSGQSPYGWSVGGQTTGEYKLATEIGKAQLKRLCAAIDNTISIDSSNSLDTIGIPDELTDNSGIDGGKLTNIRIYRQSNTSLSLTKIKSDFNGEIVSSILYVNGGVVTANPTIYTLLRDAAEDEIGVMIVGSESATEALYIDTTGNVFPVMGVQDTFRFKLYTDDIVTEFDFDTANNTTSWDIPDTVLLAGDYNTKYYMIHLTEDTSNASNTATDFTMIASKKMYHSKDTLYKKVNNVVDNKTIYPNDFILAKYGEWSIKAKAVSVIPNDLYAPEMTTGVFNNHDLILITDNTGKVTVPSFANWSSKLWYGGNSIAVGGEVTGIPGSYNSTDSVYELDQDFIQEVVNLSDANLKDSILILKKGTKIAFATDSDNLKPNSNNLSQPENYMDTYYATGYKTLKIDFQNMDAEIFKRVFPTLKAKGVTSIDFEPWTEKGRIKCDADIWAFNEKFPLGSFDTLYDGSGTFNDQVYYVAYLGNQVSISEGQFVKPPENSADFDKAAADMRIDSLGFEGNFSYGQKLYHSIGAIQNNHRRLVMLNFQPSYLKQLQHTQDLLVDAIKWISVDDFKLEKPDIYPEDGSNIHTTFDTINCAVDFTQKGQQLKEEPYTLTIELTYAGTTESKTINIPADSGTTDIDSFTVTLSDLGIIIDPTDLNSTTLDFKVIASPAKNPSFFEGSEVSGTFNIYKLKVPVVSPASQDFNGSLAINAAQDSTESPADSNGIQGVLMNWTYGSESGSDASVFNKTITESGTFEVYSSLTGYINSAPTSQSYHKNAEDIGLDKAYYLDTNTISDGYPDLIVVTFSDTTIGILDQYSISTDSVVNAIKSGISVPSYLNIDANGIIPTDTGFLVYVTDNGSTNSSDTANTSKDHFLNDSLSQTLTVTVGNVVNIKPEKIKIDDELAPVIVKADFDPTTDTLTLTFSENTTIPTTVNKDDVFIFTDNNGTVFTVTGITSQTNSGTVIKLKIGTVTKGGVESVLKNGDFIQLKGTSGVFGENYLVQDKNTNKIPITVSYYPIGLESATFLDVTDPADGKIDQIYVEVDAQTLEFINEDLLSMQDIATVLNNDNSNGTLQLILQNKNITMNSVSVINDSIIVSVTDNAVIPNTADENDSLADNDVDTAGNTAILYTDTLDIIDGVAPVLIKVTINPNDDAKDTNSIGSITLTFSEEVEKPDVNIIEDVLEFTDKDGKTYKLDLIDTTTSSSKKVDHTFLVKAGEDDLGNTVYPLDKDSVKLGDNSGITDGTNVQDKEGNNLVIEVGDYPVNTTIDAIGPFTVEDTLPDGLLDLVGIDKGTVISTETGKVNGTALVITISNAEIVSEASLFAEITIFDVVGNIVYKADSDGPKPADLTVSITKMPGSPKYAITGIWSGKNEVGRNVGTGNYLVIVSLKMYDNGKLVDVAGFPQNQTLLVRQPKEK